MYESARMSAQMHRFASAVKIHYRSLRPNKDESHSARVRTALFKPVTESSQQAGGSGRSIVEPAMDAHSNLTHLQFRLFFTAPDGKP